MLAAARHSAILAEVQRERIVRVADLARMLGVSLMTVRRDIEALDAAGAVEKIHGGAKLPGGASTHEPGFELKVTQFKNEKMAIARRLPPRCAREWPWGSARAPPRGRWPSSCPPVRGSRWSPTRCGLPMCSTRAVAVHRDPDRRRAHALRRAGGPSGHVLPQSAAPGRAVPRVHGVDADAGFTTPNVLEAETDRAFVAAARRVVVLADHTKWGTLGISTIAALEDADELISDDLLGGEAAAHPRRTRGPAAAGPQPAPPPAPPAGAAGPAPRTPPHDPHAWSCSEQPGPDLAAEALTGDRPAPGAAVPARSARPCSSISAPASRPCCTSAPTSARTCRTCRC